MACSSGSSSIGSTAVSAVATPSVASLPQVRGDDYRYLLKLMLIGNSGVGKTCFLRRFVDGIFDDQFIATIGIDFKVKTITINGARVKLQMWDTAGQERFHAITTAYYHGAMGFLLFYDVTSEASFLSVRKWMDDIGRNAPDQVEVVICGHKCDEDKGVVSSQRGQAFADEFGIPFIETSALNNIGVDDAVHTLAQAILEKLDRGIVLSPVRLMVDLSLTDVPTSSYNSRCCF